MLRVEECVLVLLAAGRSRRFGGDRSKLDQHFLGLPLGLHVAIALRGVPFRERVAVTGGSDLAYERHGFSIAHNPDPDIGMGGSVRLGVERACAIGAASVVIALADMPRVTAAHVLRLFDASTDERSVVASSDGTDSGPPALFGAGRFDRLLALDGDAGARALVRNGTHVIASPAELIDVDTVQDLEQLSALVHDPRPRLARGG